MDTETAALTEPPESEDFSEAAATETAPPSIEKKSDITPEVKDVANGENIVGPEVAVAQPTASTEEPAVPIEIPTKSPEDSEKAVLESPENRENAAVANPVIEISTEPAADEKKSPVETSGTESENKIESQPQVEPTVKQPEAETVVSAPPTETASLTPLAETKESGEVAAEVENIQPNNISEPKTPVDRAVLIEKIRASLIARDTLISINCALQSKISDVLRRRKAEEKTSERDKSEPDGDRRYSKVLWSLKGMCADLEEVGRTNGETLRESQAKLEERAMELKQQQLELSNLKRQLTKGTTVTLESENNAEGDDNVHEDESEKKWTSRESVVEQLIGMEHRKDVAVATVRLENIKLRNKLRRFEATLKQKEELGEGLHLIDFEQLKIENQAHNEKIEERNEELMKLRKKITNIVHVMAHSNEKLHYARREHSQLEEAQRLLEVELSRERDKLPLLKHRRDEQRNGTVELRQRNGLLIHERLLRDYEERVENTESMEAEIQVLIQIHTGLESKLERQKRRQHNEAQLPRLVHHECLGESKR